MLPTFIIKLRKGRYTKERERWTHICVGKLGQRRATSEAAHQNKEEA